MRISYTVRDFIEDIRTGIVNVPLEEAQFYGITEQHIRQAMKCDNIGAIPLQIRRWCIDQIGVAKQLFQEGMQAIQPTSGLGELSQKVLGSSYNNDFWRDTKRAEEQL